MGEDFRGSGGTLRETNELFVLCCFLDTTHLSPLSLLIAEHSEACPFNFRGVYAIGQEAEHLQMAVEQVENLQKVAWSPLPPSIPLASSPTPTVEGEPRGTIKMNDARQFSMHGGTAMYLESAILQPVCPGSYI